MLENSPCDFKKASWILFPKTLAITASNSSGITALSVKINLHGEKFVYIRYYALRDEDNNYLGCLEVTQDVDHIRELDGENRLL